MQVAKRWLYEIIPTIMMNKIPMTIQGAINLRTELDRLKREERPKLVKAIAEARAHGDLKENAEYHAAKEQQGLVEARIRDIESKLANANIIDVTKINAKELVVFGSTVKIENLITNEESTYQIVGEDEANIKSGKLSVNSPLARALVGKKIGDIAEVTTANGIIEYSILKIDYI